MLPGEFGFLRDQEWNLMIILGGSGSRVIAFTMAVFCTQVI